MGIDHPTHKVVNPHSSYTAVACERLLLLHTNRDEAQASIHVGMYSPKTS